MLISTHAPVRGATYCVNPNIKGVPQFQLTPLRRGRPPPARSCHIKRNFYSRPHGRGDGSPFFFIATIPDISTRAPTGGATKQLALDDIESGISTRAPTGGATSFRDCNRISNSISTRAPTGGATNILLLFLIPMIYFYSRPHGRGDSLGGSLIGSRNFISTRAPTGGATQHTSKPPKSRMEFLLAPPREGRLSISFVDVSEEVFLLAPPREGRHGRSNAAKLSKQDFYSRPHGRGDIRYRT